MREIVWRIGDPDAPREPQPGDPGSARKRLEVGNHAFAELFTEGEASGADAGQDRRLVQLAPEELGVSPTGGILQQRPFAAVISCADARVPVELLLSQRANDLFVVRVAGGVLSEGSLGSLDFAIGKLPSVHLMLSLGHTGCGAVVAAVDTYLDPASYLKLAHSRPLLALVQNLLGSVRLADAALREVHGSEVGHRPGYRAALIELAVVANAATNATAIAERVQQQVDPTAPPLLTVFGVYDLASRQVGIPGTTTPWAAGLVDAPVDVGDFTHLLHQVAFGPRMSAMIDDPMTTGEGGGR